MNRLLSLATCFSIVFCASNALADTSEKQVNLSVGEIEQSTLLCSSGETCMVSAVAPGNTKNQAALDIVFTVNGLKVIPNQSNMLLITNTSRLPKLIVMIVRNPVSWDIPVELTSASN